MRLKNGWGMSTLIVFLFRGLGAGASFILGIAVGRHLGAQQAGIFFLATAIVTLLATISRGGLDNTVLRIAAVKAAENSWGGVLSVTRISIFCSVAIGTLVAVLVVGYARHIALIFTEPLLEPVLRIIAPSIVFVAIAYLLGQAFQAMGHSILAVYCNSISIPFGVLLALWWAHSAGYLAAAYLCSAIATAAIALLLFYGKLKQKNTDGNVRIREIFRSCIPLWILSIADAAQQWGGQIISAAYVSSDELARLAAAQRLATLVSFVLITINIVAAPRFAALYKEHQYDTLRIISQRAARVILLCSAPILLGMLIFPVHLMRLFGPDFEGGATSLRILGLGQFVHAATGSVGYLLVMTGHEKEARNSMLLSTAIFFFLAFILVPKYGIVGAAVATAISLSSQKICNLIYVKRKLGFRTIAVGSVR